MVDAADSKSALGNKVLVRVRSSAIHSKSRNTTYISGFTMLKSEKIPDFGSYFGIYLKKYTENP